MLPRQCSPFQKTRGHRGSSVRKTAAAAELLSASGLVPISVWCYRHVLYSCARQNLGAISGLAGDADLPPVLQKSCAALGSSRLSGLARDIGINANTLSDVSIPQARRSQRYPLPVQSGGRRKDFFAANPGGEQWDSRSLPGF